jgi:Zn-finger nucleic acid-binding protein
MNCPKCLNNELSEAKVKKTVVRVDFCKSCKGIWFDRFELERLMDNSVWDMQVPSGAQRSDFSCPKCCQYMRTFHYPDTEIIIEACKSCHGVWLDAGELKKIEATRGKLKEMGLLGTKKQSFLGAVIDKVLEGMKV